MYKPKLPFQYEKDDCSIRDADYKLIGHIGGEKHLFVTECDEVGKWIVDILNNYEAVAGHRTEDANG